MTLSNPNRETRNLDDERNRDAGPNLDTSEQQLRHSVIDRRITQGTRGQAGQRYHERMWTAIATCKKQNRNFFTFLYESITAQLQNQAGPSLLYG